MGALKDTDSPSNSLTQQDKKKLNRIQTFLQVQNLLVVQDITFFHITGAQK